MKSTSNNNTKVNPELTPKYFTIPIIKERDNTLLNESNRKLEELITSLNKFEISQQDIVDFFKSQKGSVFLNLMKSYFEFFSNIVDKNNLDEMLAIFDAVIDKCKNYEKLPTEGIIPKDDAVLYTRGMIYLNKIYYLLKSYPDRLNEIKISQSIYEMALAMGSKCGPGATDIINNVYSELDMYLDGNLEKSIYHWRKTTFEQFVVDKINEQNDFSFKSGEEISFPLSNQHHFVRAVSNDFSHVYGLPFMQEKYDQHIEGARRSPGYPKLKTAIDLHFILLIGSREFVHYFVSSLLSEMKVDLANLNLSLSSDYISVDECTGEKTISTLILKKYIDRLKSYATRSISTSFIPFSNLSELPVCKNRDGNNEVFLKWTVAFDLSTAIYHLLVNEGYFLLSPVVQKTVKTNDLEVDIYLYPNNCFLASYVITKNRLSETVMVTNPEPKSLTAYVLESFLTDSPIKKLLLAEVQAVQLAKMEGEMLRTVITYLSSTSFCNQTDEKKQLDLSIIRDLILLMADKLINDRNFINFIKAIKLDPNLKYSQKIIFNAIAESKLIMNEAVLGVIGQPELLMKVLPEYDTSSPSKTNLMYTTLIVSAIEENNDKMLQAIITCASNNQHAEYIKNIINEKGLLLLAISKPGSDVQLIRLLLEAGADFNLCTKDKSTPLMLAAFNGKLEILELLIKYGANPSLVNPKGETFGAILFRYKLHLNDKYKKDIDIDRFAEIDPQLKMLLLSLACTKLKGLIDHLSIDNNDPEILVKVDELLIKISKFSDQKIILVEETDIFEVLREKFIKAQGNNKVLLEKIFELIIKAEIGLYISPLAHRNATNALNFASPLLNAILSDKTELVKYILDKIANPIEKQYFHALALNAIFRLMQDNRAYNEKKTYKKVYEAVLDSFFSTPRDIKDIINLLDLKNGLFSPEASIRHVSQPSPEEIDLFLNYVIVRLKSNDLKTLLLHCLLSNLISYTQIDKFKDKINIKETIEAYVNSMQAFGNTKPNLSFYQALYQYFPNYLPLISLFERPINEEISLEDLNDRNRLKNIVFLIKSGAPIYSRNKTYKTCILFKVIDTVFGEDGMHLVKTLLSHPAIDLTIANGKRETAFDRVLARADAEDRNALLILFLSSGKIPREVLINALTQAHKKVQDFSKYQRQVEWAITYELIDSYLSNNLVNDPDAEKKLKTLKGERRRAYNATPTFLSKWLENHPSPNISNVNNLGNITTNISTNNVSMGNNLLIMFSNPIDKNSKEDENKKRSFATSTGKQNEQDSEGNAKRNKSNN